MSTSHNLAPHGDDNVVPEGPAPEGGFELYRYKNAERMTTKSWHGYYWARRTENGDYEIFTVPFTLGEHSVPGGVFPKEGFEGQFEKVSS